MSGDVVDSCQITMVRTLSPGIGSLAAKSPPGARKPH
jgi:hypothetical protein